MTVARGKARSPRRGMSLAASLTGFVGRAPLHMALLLIAVTWLVPTVGLLVTSLRYGQDIYSTGWWTAFGQWRFTLSNYGEVLTTGGPTGTLGRNFINSFIITIPPTIAAPIVASLAAYAFTWIKFPGRDWIFLLIIGLMIVPEQMTFVPVLRLFNQLGLATTFIGIWIAHTAYALPLPIFLFRNFFVSLPGELIDSARIDGASELTIAWRIVMPLSVPAIASYIIFQFLWVWNDLLMSLVYLQDPLLQPITVGISNMLTFHALDWDLLSAAAFLAMVVPLTIFFSLQRYFVRGLVAGSVKT